jgi:hypothetical protein
MKNFKATDEQWKSAEEYGTFACACILELRARVMALEAQAGSQEVAEPAPVAGEVEELVANLRTMATDAGLACQPGDFKILALAADMIQRLGKQEVRR